MEKTITLNLNVSVKINYDDESITKEQAKADITSAIRDCALNKLVEEGIDSEAQIESITVTDQRHYKGICMVCSKYDFSVIHGYDLSNVSDEEVDQMIEEVCQIMYADDLAGDSLANAVDSVAQKHHLPHPYL